MEQQGDLAWITRRGFTLGVSFRKQLAKKRQSEPLEGRRVSGASHAVILSPKIALGAQVTCFIASVTAKQIIRVVTAQFV